MPYFLILDLMKKKKIQIHQEKILKLFLSPNFWFILKISILQSGEITNYSEFNKYRKIKVLF